MRGNFLQKGTSATAAGGGKREHEEWPRSKKSSMAKPCCFFRAPQQLPFSRTLFKNL